MIGGNCVVLIMHKPESEHGYCKSDSKHFRINKLVLVTHAHAKSMQCNAMQ